MGKSASSREAITLFLADDHPVLRAGLKVSPYRQPDLEVCAEAPNGFEAVTLVETLALDLVVIDVSLPGLNGGDATRQIKKLRPGLPVLALSVHEEIPFVRMMSTRALPATC